MIAGLLFLSALVFIPGAHPLVDAYDLPKTALVGVLSVAVWINFYLRASRGEEISFPFLGAIALFLGLAALSWINATNAHYFFYALGAMLAGFSFFFYGANLPPASLWLAPVVVGAAYAATPWLGITTTVGNQERGSAMAALAAAITAAQVKSQKSKVKKAAGLLLLVPILLFLYQAEMRSAMVGLAIGVLVWLWLSGRRIAAVSVAAAAVLAARAWPGLVSYFLVDHSPRPAIWEAALGIANGDTWLLGIGVGQFKLYSQAWIHEASFGAGYFRELHNDYLQLLVEAGPLALMAWIYLLCKILFTGSKVQGLISPLVIGLVAVMVNAFFLFPFQLPIEAAWFWLVAGIYYGERRD